MRIAILVLAACGGGSGSRADAPQPPHSGYIQLQSYDAMNAPGTATHGGSATAALFATGEQCTTMRHVGPCDLVQCAAVAPPAASGGTITITGAALPLSLTPAADGTYAEYSTQTMPLFAGGESITFAAAGADVPAFTKTLSMPTKATITAPAKPTGYLAISRTQDLAIGWSGGGSGLVQITLLGQLSTDPRLQCRFSAGAGAGVVPAAALATVSTGMAAFAMASISDSEQDAGDWAIDVSGYFNAVWPDDSIVSGAASLQ
ncbi:MAG: hypothetical protein ACM31C_16975 [Acidobacteriota bacterium]